MMYDEQKVKSGVHVSKDDLGQNFFSCKLSFSCVCGQFVPFIDDLIIYLGQFYLLRSKSGWKINIIELRKWCIL